MRLILIFLGIYFNFSFSFAGQGNDCNTILNKFINTNQSIVVKTASEFLPPLHTIIKVNEDLGIQIFTKTRDQFLLSMNSKVLNLSFSEFTLKIKNGKLIGKMQNNEEFYQDFLIDMKAKRKSAAALRSVFIVFSKEHKSPNNFETFTKEFGKFNDKLEFKAWDTLQKSSKKLEETYEIKKIYKELEHFKISKQEDMIKNLEQIKMEILDLIDKEELTVSEFHETRKLLKHFLNTVQLIVQIENKAELVPAYKFLNELNDSLGALRDNVLKEQVLSEENGIKLKVNEKEVIPEEIRKNIRTFLDGLIIED